LAVGTNRPFFLTLCRELLSLPKRLVRRRRRFQHPPQNVVARLRTCGFYHRVPSFCPLAPSGLHATLYEFEQIRLLEVLHLQQPEFGPDTVWGLAVEPEPRGCKSLSVHPLPLPQGEDFSQSAKALSVSTPERAFVFPNQVTDPVTRSVYTLRTMRIASSVIFATIGKVSITSAIATFPVF
jgi:hypothetical protein